MGSCCVCRSPRLVLQILMCCFLVETARCVIPSPCYTPTPKNLEDYWIYTSQFDDGVQGAALIPFNNPDILDCKTGQNFPGQPKGPVYFLGQQIPTSLRPELSFNCSVPKKTGSIQVVVNSFRWFPFKNDPADTRTLAYRTARTVNNTKSCYAQGGMYARLDGKLLDLYYVENLYIRDFQDSPNSFDVQYFGLSSDPASPAYVEDLTFVDNAAAAYIAVVKDYQIGQGRRPHLLEFGVNCIVTDEVLGGGTINYKTSVTLSLDA